MILTPEQIVASNCADNSLIIACPGSGKTRTLISKMLVCLDDVRHTPHRLAILTYTNTAVHEIEFRLWEYGESGDSDYCDIATIHSFCLSYILQHFYEYLPEYTDGFTVIPTSSATYKALVSETLESFGMDPKYILGFENLNRLPDGSPVVGSDIPEEVIQGFWEKLQQEGLIDFPNIIYYAYKLISEHRSIGEAIAAKYKWILVDEFQDTSALQIEIFRAIEQCGSVKWFLVGDPLQSIFGFAGAVPEKLYEFAAEVHADMSVELLGNFRSSQMIVDHAERLCPRHPPMESIGINKDFGVEPQHIQVDSFSNGIVETFIPALSELKIPFGSSAIFAPWWFQLYQVARELRNLGVPIYGPGSRPYKRTHMFAMIAEHICEFLSTNNARSFHRLEKELFNVLDQLESKRQIRKYSFESRLIVQKLVRAGQELDEGNRDGVSWLEAAAKRVAGILVDLELITDDAAEMLCHSALEMVEEMILNKVDIFTLSIADLGMFADGTRSINLLTLHKAKGREFDAVAIIDVHEGKLPHYLDIKAHDLARIEESRRLFYVGITRARKYLLYMTKRPDWNTQPSRFLREEGLGIL